MSKKPVKGNFNIAPWKMDPRWKERYIIITEENRKMAVVTGRWIYVIRHGGHYSGRFNIRPLLQKGKIREQDGSRIHDMFVFKNESPQEYKEIFKAIIDRGIEEKILFINPTDTIIKYYKL